ncbi:MAG: hypothetical protein LUC98_11580 [Lachnospiraceae bacterium]|nr:hypothetical protein [Lachnospiraceae bacterium]
MSQDIDSMMGRILDTEQVGYAYFYPLDGSAREEYFLSTSPENLANFLGSHFEDAQKVIVTDMLDRLILDTFGGFINRCPDTALCQDIIRHLAPIQMGEREAGEILVLDRYDADHFFEDEEAEVMMAEFEMCT